MVGAEISEDGDYELCSVTISVIPYGNGAFMPDIELDVPDTIRSLDEIAALSEACRTAGNNLEQIVHRLQMMDEEEE